jgi:hypothetical protein
MTTAAFTLIYRFVPNTRVRWLAALTGGVVAGVLVESARIRVRGLRRFDHQATRRSIPVSPRRSSS